MLPEGHKLILYDKISSSEVKLRDEFSQVSQPMYLLCHHNVILEFIGDTIGFGRVWLQYQSGNRHHNVIILIIIFYYYCDEIINAALKLKHLGER